MSEKKTLTMEDYLEQHDYTLPQDGDIRQGVIVAINEQDIIVDLGLKRDGLVPPTDLAKLSDEDRAALTVGDEIDVYIMNSNEPNALHVSIFMARINKDWTEAERIMNAGEIIEGQISGYNKGGAIVPFGQLSGFIPTSHLSELTPGMSERKRQQRLAKLREQTIPLKIIEVDRHQRRLVLSQREAQREWEQKVREELMKTLKVGDVLTGRVSGIRDFGIFIDLGGADGMVHISQLTWGRIEHPSQVVKVGDEIEVAVLKLDTDKQRIGLSRKKLLENPWKSVKDRYNEGQLIEGKITRLVEYGAFAEIEPGVEGLLHLSQISRNMVEKASDVISEGETHLLRILTIDPKRQRVGLSLKAVTTAEQIDWMAMREETDVKTAVVDEITAVVDNTKTEEE
jgi:small subunit ribosomal protein S1